MKNTLLCHIRMLYKCGEGMGPVPTACVFEGAIKLMTEIVNNVSLIWQIKLCTEDRCLHIGL